MGIGGKKPSNLCLRLTYCEKKPFKAMASALNPGNSTWENVIILENLLCLLSLHLSCGPREQASDPQVSVNSQSPVAIQCFEECSFCVELNCLHQCFCETNKQENINWDYCP